MIENEFGFSDIRSVDLAVALRAREQRYFVPTDGAIKEQLKRILQATKASFLQIEIDWERHDISEDYGDRRRVYAARDSDYLADLSGIYNVSHFPDLSNVHEHIQDIEYYFAIFHDNKAQKVVGIKKATQLKTTLGARNRLVRLVDDTLQLIEDDVLRLDRKFDAIIADKVIFMLNVRSVEYLANIVEHVAGAAATKIQQIHDAVTFLDMSRIKGSIGEHPRMARMAASIASRSDLAQIKRERVVELADHHGLVLKKVDGRLRCRRQDEAKLLEILDARRYHLDLTATQPVPYRATARQRVV